MSTISSITALGTGRSVMMNLRVYSAMPGALPLQATNFPYFRPRFRDLTRRSKNSLTCANCVAAR